MPNPKDRNLAPRGYCSPKAFTLIELLVVIAIIAILAAILFPVFAQAKRAAKASASLSNVKQQALSVTMYAGDADDTFVPCQTNDDSPGGYGNGPHNEFPWTKLVYPYQKNSEIFMDPLGPRFNGTQPTYSNQDMQFQFPRYGLNYLGLNTVSATGFSGRSTTAAASPAETIMIASRSGTFGDSRSMPVVGYGAWYFTLHTVALSPLSGITPVLNWGKDGYLTSGGDAISSAEGGKYTAGVAFRAAGYGAAVAYVDGHANMRKPGALAIGTTGYRFDPAGNGSKTSEIALSSDAGERARYLWDTE